MAVAPRRLGALLIHEFPPWPTIHDYFRQWRTNGVLERLNSILGQQERVEAGRQANPSGGTMAVVPYWVMSRNSSAGSKDTLLKIKRLFQRIAEFLFSITPTSE